MIDIQAAAKILNLTPQQVRTLCRNNKLKGTKVGKTWILKEKDINEYYQSTSCGVAEDHEIYLTRNDVLKNKRPFVLSFFSGAMGLDIGLEKAGFHTILASEIDNACRKTIKRNKPEIALIGDIRNYSAQDVLNAAGLTIEDDIDVIAGGPPCQAFSTAGKRKAFEDERGNVFLSFIELITTLKPKYAIIENVRGLLSSPLRHRPHNQRGKDYPPLSPEEEPGGALFHILNQLNAAGYGVSFNLYNAANFGTPQKRERVVLICSRDGSIPPHLEPTHSEDGSLGLPPWKTLEETIGDLMKYSHRHLSFPEKRLKYYRILKAGQNWRALPKDIQKEALGASFDAGGGKTGFLRRLAWDKPAPTLVTHPAMPATDLAHPVFDRPLSIEEYHRIQQFPDNWKIEGSLIEQYKQIGNAVPVGLGEAIGNLLMKLLNNKKIVPFKNFKYSRYKNTDEKSWKRNFEQNYLNKQKPVLFNEK